MNQYAGGHISANFLFGLESILVILLETSRNVILTKIGRFDILYVVLVTK